jgi:hypothetical protein
MNEQESNNGEIKYWFKSNETLKSGDHVYVGQHEIFSSDELIRQ